MSLTNNFKHFSELPIETEITKRLMVPVIQRVSEIGASETVYENVLVPAMGLAAGVATHAFDSVAAMMVCDDLTPGTVVSTRGYFKPLGHGAATYDIWDLDAYRALINNPGWLPDGEEITVNGLRYYAGGDHMLRNNLVAILRFNALWAGQLGLPDPVKDEAEYIAKRLHHDHGMQKAVDFAKRVTSAGDRSATSTNGIGTHRNIMLHIEPGNYVLTHTIWIPGSVLLVGGSMWGTGGRYVDFIPLKAEHGGSLINYVRGYTFIWNGNRYWPGTEEIPIGATPAESIYSAPYVGGMSGISINNYETSYGMTDGVIDYYKPNYLKGIKGCMVFGGAIFHSCNGERVWIFAHRPGVDWLDYYTDGWVIRDYKCNTPFENEEYQLDFNGSGDIIDIDGVQFPVTVELSDPNEMWAKGEYLNGPPKGIRLHNWASWDIKPPGEGGSNEQISYVGAGMRIQRVINGVIDIYGYRQVQIEASHFEFGQIILNQGSASVADCYFSKNTKMAYNSIECRPGFYGGIGADLSLKRCEFHRGFDGSHLPVEDGYYDLVINNNFTVVIEDCFQGWDTADSNQKIGITVGLYNKSNDNVVTITPLPGWDRWSAYLSQGCTIVRGKMSVQTRETMWGGFEGVQEVNCTPSNNKRNFDMPANTTYYYFAQFLVDPGDDTVGPDFIPLGRNQRERFVLDAQGNPTTERFEASCFVKPNVLHDDGTNPPYESYFRPVAYFYGEDETPDISTIRLYRGTSPMQYDEYVDLPMMSRAAIDDYGTTVYGRKWKPNPVAKDTNPDLTLRKRNVLPVTGNDLTSYTVKMRAGSPLAMTVDRGMDFYNRQELEYIGTGGWSANAGTAVIRASNTGVNAADEQAMASICIFDRLFTTDVYVNLPVTGAPNWDGSRTLKYKKGARSDIVRSKTTAPEDEDATVYDLIVQTELPGGIVKELYRMLPGETVTAFYDEKDVLQPDGKTYLPVGEWIIVRGTLSTKADSEHHYIDAEAGGYYNLLPDGIHETTINYNYANTTEEIYAGVPFKAKVGSRVKIVRGAFNNGDLNVLVKVSEDVQDSIINIPVGNNTTELVKKASGWVIESQINAVDTKVNLLGTQQYADLTPESGILKYYCILNQPLPALEDNQCIYRLTHSVKGRAVPPGSYVRVYRDVGATYDGELDIIIRQTDDDDNVQAVLANLIVPGQWVDLIYDGSNWSQVGSNNAAGSGSAGGGVATASNTYVIVTTDWTYYDADTLAQGRLFLDHRFAPATTTAETGLTFDVDAAVGSEVYIKTTLPRGVLVLQTSEGEIKRITKAGVTHMIKVAEGGAPSAWFVIGTHAIQAQ